MDPIFTQRGFLPREDPMRAFPEESDLAVLDRVGRELPDRLEDADFRRYVRGLRIPEWTGGTPTEDTLPALRLYYVRLGFLASAYVNQVGQPGAETLPANVSIPLVNACALLR